MKIPNIRLINLGLTESLAGKPNWEVRPCTLANFNLILGDNAQGKTRFFNILRFLKNLHAGSQLPYSPGLSVTLNMTFADAGSTIQYKIFFSMQPNTPEFQEEISKDNKLIFSRQKNLLVEEDSGKIVSNFFLPTHTSVVSSAAHPSFPTFQKLKSFFERMLFLEANRFRAGELDIAKDALILGPTGANIGSVLDTWRRTLPEAYKEVVEEFQDCFTFILRDSVTTREDLLPGHGIHTPQVFFKEKETMGEVRQLEWSDGMLRTLCLFALPATRFSGTDGAFDRPSMVCVDEIENGLDFNTLSNVLSFFEGYSDLMQVLIASHSPTVCNLVDPKNWLIAKRRGLTVELISPSNKEPNLNEQRKKLLKDNWEFYKNHIAKSKLYSVH